MKLACIYLENNYIKNLVIKNIPYFSFIYKKKAVLQMNFLLLLFVLNLLSNRVLISDITASNMYLPILYDILFIFKVLNENMSSIGLMKVSQKDNQTMDMFMAEFIYIKNRDNFSLGENNLSCGVKNE